MSDTLDTYHDRMDAILTSAEALLRADDKSALVTLTRSRFDMAHLLSAYQLFIHREVFEPSIAAGTADEVARAKALKVECIMLADAFRTYVKHWSVTEIESVWPEYRRAAGDMLRRLRAHLERSRSDAPGLLASARARAAARPIRAA
jgi:hypothetical protein